MTKYLVDFENVKCDGLTGIDKLSKNDIVYIFYSINADRITFELHNMINSSLATIRFYNVPVGTKNALDFQLATYLGYMISENKKDEFVIVTKDKDYSVVVSFWQKMNANVTIKNSLEKPLLTTSTVYLIEDDDEEQEQKEKPEAKKETKSSKKKKAKKKASNKKQQTENESDYKQRVLGKITDEEKRGFVEECINKYSSKLEINNAIVRKYGTNQSKFLYNLIKPLISSK